MDLTADQTWTQIRDLKVGDKVVAKYRWGGDAEVHEEEVEVVKEASKTSRSSAKDYAVVRRKCNQKIRFPQDGSNDTDIVAYVSIVKKAEPQFKSVCFDPDDDDDICLDYEGSNAEDREYSSEQHHHERNYLDVSRWSLFLHSHRDADRMRDFFVSLFNARGDIHHSDKSHVEAHIFTLTCIARHMVEVRETDAPFLVRGAKKIMDELYIANRKSKLTYKEVEVMRGSLSGIAEPERYKDAEKMVAQSRAAGFSGRGRGGPATRGRGRGGSSKGGGSE
eukprot:PhM_4_TR9469/c2_g9_i2/m.56271